MRFTSRGVLGAAIDMPKIFPLFSVSPWDLSKTTPYGLGLIMKIFQSLRKN
jgi:hypothetical protein